MPFERTENTGAKDLALVRAAMQGIHEACDELARRMAVVLRILVVLNRRQSSRLSPQDVEDLAQDTFLLVWGKLANFHGETELEGWLYRFCFLEYLNRVRRSARIPNGSSVAPEEVPDSSGGTLPDGRLETLERCLVELGPPDEIIVRLKHFEELSFDSIGVRLALPTSTVKTRYYRGIAWMHRRLRGELLEAGS